MKKQAIFWSVVLILLLSLGWGVFAQEVQETQQEVQEIQEESSKKTVVAEVNGEPIYLEDVQEIWDTLPEVYRIQFPGGIQDILEQLIRETLLVQQAQKLGLENDPVILEQLEQIKRQLLVTELIKREIVDKVQVSDEEIEKEYTSNPSLYTEPEQVKAKHIMTSTKEKADEVLQELQSGRPFEEVAKEKSESPDAQQGGEMGYLKKGDLDPNLEKVLFDLAPGKFSDVVETSYGFHIFLVEEHLKPRLKEVEEVKDEISNRLLPRKQQEAFEKLIEELKSQTEIAIIEENLPKEATPQPEASPETGGESQP
ncbi:MAG TPA: peptidylprolyl isomerase [Candidatus Atribacteria bacterium]|nr:peptidylprolyl isomerase [Candidatus Atribacteria bacterium]